MFTKSSSTIDFIEDETAHKITDPKQICESVMTKTDPIDSEIPGPTPETLLSYFTIAEDWDYVWEHINLMAWNKSSGPDEKMPQHDSVVA